MSGPQHAYDDFRVVVSEGASEVHVQLWGELDVASAERVGAVLRDLVGSPGSILLDLGGLTFMDASGLRALMTAKHRLGGRLRVRPGPRQVQRLLVLTGLEGEFAFVDGESDAPPDAAAAANVAYLRELWTAFRSGGFPALSALLDEPRERLPASAEQPVAWSSRELSAFWAAAAGQPPREGREGETVNRCETIGSHVLVARAPAPAPAVFWTLYLFEGRTFIRALSFGDEAQARSCARNRDRSVTSRSEARGSPGSDPSVPPPAA
jgi:anti-sigma B factor antagonist